MAIQPSPSIRPGKPGLIDPSRQAEFPVLLGQSLREGKAAQSSQSLNVRYNWKSKKISQRQLVTETESASRSYNLAVQEGKTEPIKYSGSIDPSSYRSDSTSLALIFDKDKSAFVLESISKSLNFNVTSAATKSNVHQLSQLKTTTSQKEAPASQHDADDALQIDEDSPADDHNPYDFRHFLLEAKTEGEGGVSPAKPSLMGIGSPRPGSAKLLSTKKLNSSLQSPFMGPGKPKKNPPAAKPQGVRKRSDGSSQTPSLISRTSKTTGKSGIGRELTGKTLRSDESSSESQVTLKHRQDRVNRRDTTPPAHIIVDEASDLTIDMGSPAPTAKPKHRINPDAFSGNSRTTSRANTASISPGRRQAKEDDEEGSIHNFGRREGDGHERVNQADNDNSDDEAIEDLSLPSPQATRGHNDLVSRISQDIVEDDDDDGLAAELEAAFEQEDDKDDNMIGLGISGEQQQAMAQDDEESEVSEEE